jgi:hypothetical protein
MFLVRPRGNRFAFAELFTDDPNVLPPAGSLHSDTLLVRPVFKGAEKQTIIRAVNEVSRRLFGIYSLLKGQVIRGQIKTRSGE